MPRKAPDIRRLPPKQRAREADTRVLRALEWLRLHQGYDAYAGLVTTKYMLAKLTGLTPQTVMTVLKRLTESWVISMEVRSRLLCVTAQPYRGAKRDYRKIAERWRDEQLAHERRMQERQERRKATPTEPCTASFEQLAPAPALREDTLAGVADRRRRRFQEVN